jgi:hypothetical protein
VGDFEVPIKVEDGDSQDPESDTATLHIQVRPNDKLMMARKFAKAPNINGKLEGDPWQFNTPIEKVLSGEPRGKVLLDYGWDDEKFYVAVLVEDDSLIGSRWSFKEGTDLVRVFLDGQNNREETYNWDDFIFALNPSGGNSHQGRTFRTGSKTGEVEGGYLVEIAVPFGNLGYRIVSKEKKKPTWLCVGLDFMVTDVDEKEGEPVSRIIWKGTEENLTNPSQFQTLVMSPE